VGKCELEGFNLHCVGRVASLLKHFPDGQAGGEVREPLRHELIRLRPQNRIAALHRPADLNFVDQGLQCLPQAIAQHPDLHFVVAQYIPSQHRGLVGYQTVPIRLGLEIILKAVKQLVKILQVLAGQQLRGVPRRFIRTSG